MSSHFTYFFNLAMYKPQMSLGFLNVQPHKISNLPGTTNSQFSRAPVRRRQPPMVSPPSLLATSANSITPESIMAIAKTATATNAVPEMKGTLRAASTGMLSRRLQFIEDAIKSCSNESLKQDNEAAMLDLYQSTNQVMATARRSMVCVDEEGEVKEGETFSTEEASRVVLVYPMKELPDGRIIMRQKRVHSDSGQLSLDWVVIQDPLLTPQKSVYNFTLL